MKKNTGKNVNRFWVIFTAILAIIYPVLLLILPNSPGSICDKYPWAEYGGAVFLFCLFGILSILFYIAGRREGKVK